MITLSVRLASNRAIPKHWVSSNLCRRPILLKIHSSRNFCTAATNSEKPPDLPITQPSGAPEALPKKPRPLIVQYLALTKFRLASLVLATTACGYMLGPMAINPTTLGWTCLGTFLTIGSANSINQYIEVDNDTMMNRTAKRPLPSGEMSLNHALAFGITTGILGASLLAVYVNEIAAILAFSNIILYTLAYTPLKQIHWTNTWVGAIVGAIPPVIGWVANGGELYTMGSFCLAYALFLWQIPHFLALSVPLEQDYTRAGYKMLVSKDPKKVATLTLRYSCYLLALAPLAVYGDFMTEWFLVDCTLLNLWMISKAYRFWKTGTSTDAKKAFLSTLSYLPLLILLFLIHKKEGYHLETNDNLTVTDGLD